MKPTVAAGVDLGGTNLKIALVDQDAVVVAQCRCALDIDGGPDRVVAGIADTIVSLLKESDRNKSDLAGIGLGAPGPLSVREGRIIRSANLPGWEDVPIRMRLEAAVGKPVILENDGNAAAFGEYWVGRERSADDLVMLTLGTGVGAGVILDGRVFHGCFENAAELGHTIVQPDGLPCACGQRGCLEQYASASGLARRAVLAIKDGEATSLVEVAQSGHSIDARIVESYARKGDALCLRLWDEACRYLAIACINIQHTFNVPRILLGGGMSEAGAFLIDRVRIHVEQQRWSLHDDTPTIQLASLGYDAGVIGAAGLVWQALDTQD